MVRLIVAILVILSSPASACPDDWPPPPQYDYAPTNLVEYQTLDRDTLNDVCHQHFIRTGALWPPQGVRGCSYIDREGKGHIFVRKGGSGCLTEEAIYRHEAGHINGWLHDEPARP